MSPAQMIQQFLFGFVISFCVNWLLRPVIAKAGWVDKPSGRKKHMRPTVISGGLAMFSALAIGLLTQNIDTTHLWLPLAALTLMFVVGFLDDRHPIRARYRLLVQVTAAVALVLGTGAAVERFGLIEGLDLARFNGFSIGVSVFFLVGLINAFNMSDGSDGVASGYAFVALLGLLTFHFLGDGASIAASPIASSTAFLMTGAVLGYGLFNYPLIRYRPAQTFMGDGGSMVLGLVAGWLILKAGQPQGSKPLHFWYAVWLVAMPVFDASFCILSRILRGKDPFMPERRHLHHLMKRRGHSRRSLALTLHTLSVTCAAIGLMLWYLNAPDYISLWVFLVAFGIYSATVSMLWGVAEDNTAWRLPKFRIRH